MIDTSKLIPLTPGIFDRRFDDLDHKLTGLIIDTGKLSAKLVELKVEIKRTRLIIVGAMLVSIIMITGILLTSQNELLSILHTIATHYPKYGHQN